MSLKTDKLDTIEIQLKKPFKYNKETIETLEFNKKLTAKAVFQAPSMFSVRNEEGADPLDPSYNIGNNITFLMQYMTGLSDNEFDKLKAKDIAQIQPLAIEYGVPKLVNFLGGDDTIPCEDFEIDDDNYGVELKLSKSYKFDLDTDDKNILRIKEPDGKCLRKFPGMNVANPIDLLKCGAYLSKISVDDVKRLDIEDASNLAKVVSSFFVN